MSSALAGLFAALASVTIQGNGWSSFNIRGQKADQIVDLHVPVTVHNRGEQQIRLANCDEDVTVLAGGNASMTMTGKFAFWVVPTGLEWNCNTGPFDLFAVGADLTGPDLKLGVGVNVMPDDQMKEGEGQEEQHDNDDDEDDDDDNDNDDDDDDDNDDDNGDEASKEQVQRSSSDVLGVVLVTDGEVPRSVACVGDSCTGALDLDVMPSGVDLHIIGHNSLEGGNSGKANFLSRHWHGSGHHHHWHGQHHHVHHHHHYGHPYGHPHGHHYGHGWW